MQKTRIDHGEPITTNPGAVKPSMTPANQRESIKPLVSGQANKEPDKGPEPKNAKKPEMTPANQRESIKPLISRTEQDKGPENE